MKATTKTVNSKPSTKAPSTQQSVSGEDFLSALMEFTAYERGWGPVPSAGSIAILAEQRGSAYASSHTATASPHPRSAIHPSDTEAETPAYTFTSYYDLARRAPLTERAPYLPQFCPHSAQQFVPPRSSGCRRCNRQLLACDIWFSWSSVWTGELRAPAALPTTNTVETCSIYYALGIPFSQVDRVCIDRDIAKSIIVPRRTVLVCPSNKKTEYRGSLRIHTLFRRMRHVFSVPSRVP